MNKTGVAVDSAFYLLARTRTVLLDALEALVEHRDVVVVVGAQAVYLRTGGIQVAIAEATKDSDVAIDTRELGEDPTINAAMEKAAFIRSPSGQPGAWVTSEVSLWTSWCLTPSPEGKAVAACTDHLTTVRRCGARAAWKQR